MPTPRRSPRNPRLPAPASHWQQLPDEKLIQLRLRDLKLTLKGTHLERYVRQLYDELAGAGLQFRPHCWLAEEWFSPDGIPGIAIPFYLAHPRLKRLERRMTQEVEGGDAKSLMCLLRHEAGHALDSAYRLRRRRGWRQVFGRASTPYADVYRPQPGSRRFVQHLDAWYAQSHPTEDFAETFAVWLKPGSRWRHAYRDWPALVKLEYVDRLMHELKGRRRLVRSRLAVDSVREDNRTLAEYYRTKLDRYAPMSAHLADHMIRRVFTVNPASSRTMRAASLLRRFKGGVQRELAARIGVSQYLIRQVLRLAIQRCEVLGLYVRGPVRDARQRALALVLRLTRLQLSGRAGHHAR